MPSLIDRLFPSSQPSAPSEPVPTDVATPTRAAVVEPGTGAPAAARPPRSGLDRLFPRQGTAAGSPPRSPAAGISPGGYHPPTATNGAEPGTAVLVGGELAAGEAGVQVTTPSADAAAGTCANCSAPLAGEQEWCLECGAEVARAEPRPWRLGLTVAGSLLVLAAIGFGIAYVALSDRSERDAALAGPPSPGQLSTPSPVSAAPPGTTTPVAPAVGPVTGTPGPLPSPAPAQTPVTPGPAATPAPATGSAPTSPTGGSSTGTAPTKPKTIKPSTPKSPTNPNNLVKPSPNQAVRPISFDPGSAHGFPSGSAGANSQDAGLAVDKNPSTAWFTSTPDTGIYVDAGVPTPIKSVTVTTTTPGFTAAIYGAVSGPPASLSGWTQLAGSTTVASKQPFNVSGSGQYRFIMVYVSRLPSGGSRANVNELAVLP